MYFYRPEFVLYMIDDHLHAVIRPDDVALVGYELVFGTTSGEGIPRSNIPKPSALPKALKQLLHAPRKENQITSRYHWEDYGTDHTYYEPTLIVHVANVGDDPVSTIDRIFQRVNASVQNTPLKLEGSVILYYAPPPQDNCDSLSKGADEYYAEGVPLKFPNSNTAFSEEAKTIWTKLREYTKLRKRKLEERINDYKQERNWIRKFNKRFP